MMTKELNNEIELFFGTKLSKDLENYKEKQISQKLNQSQIMNIIDFTPPFLRIDKMIIFDMGGDSLQRYVSLGMGIVSPKDTFGHYNESIYLAMCGWLMASSASVHLAILFPSAAPQVIEANGVKPLLSFENKDLWKPAKEGTPFFVETNIIKKKLSLLIVRAKITFGNILYGAIDELKLVLTKKETIQSVKEIPFL